MKIIDKQMLPENFFFFSNNTLSKTQKEKQTVLWRLEKTLNHHLTHAKGPEMPEINACSQQTTKINTFFCKSEMPKCWFSGPKCFIWISSNYK